MAKKLEYDLNALKKVFESGDDSSRTTLALSLIKQATFLDKKLSELEDDINKNGLNIQMQQGEYFITRANPSCNTYNAFIKNYNSVVKQLIELLPAEQSSDEKEESYF